jgi:DNA-directed RNA polymerase subunit M/transcription elongation factor TFIIS
MDPNLYNLLSSNYNNLKELINLLKLENKIRIQEKIFLKIFSNVVSSNEDLIDHSKINDLERHLNSLLKQIIEIKKGVSENNFKKCGYCGNIVYLSSSRSTRTGIFTNFYVCLNCGKSYKNNGSSSKLKEIPYPIFRGFIG